MRKFSERNGYMPVPESMTPETITPALRNSIWNVIDALTGHGRYNEVTSLIWRDLYKLPVDDRPYRVGVTDVSWSPSWKQVKSRIIDGEWYEAYDHIEFFCNYDSYRFESKFNQVLMQEAAPYRVLNGKVTAITAPNEIESVRETAAATDRFAPVAAHIATAVTLLSDRQNPDYRNSIKESISAVESAAKIVTGDSKVELGKLLATLEKKGKINGALRSGFSSIYGWTSDQNGIRHAMTEASNVTQDDAKLFLVMCSAFANYLKTVDLS